MKTKLIVALAAASLLSVSGAALAADAAAGKKKAEGCMADCHVPNEDFAGKDAASIEKSIKEVQAGKVKHKKKLPALSDADIADIAAYFAAEGKK